MDDPGDDPPVGIDPRFSLANERTFLAWNRTALALLTAGLAITQFFKPFSVPGGRRVIGVPLVAIGAVVAFASYARWRQVEAAMHRGEPVPPSWLLRVLAVGITLSAAVALVLITVADG